MRPLLTVILVTSSTLLMQAAIVRGQDSANSLKTMLASSTALKPEGGNPAPRPGVTVSTGATPPELIHIAKLTCASKQPRMTARPLTFVVKLVVDESGRPTQMHVDETVDRATDQEVLDTIGRFRYKPGKLNGKEVAYPATVIYRIAPGAVY
jgi:hypothetical protein